MLLVANFASSVCAIVGPTPRSIETSLAGHVLDVVRLPLSLCCSFALSLYPFLCLLSRALTARTSWRKTCGSCVRFSSLHRWESRSAGGRESARTAHQPVPLLPRSLTRNLPYDFRLALLCAVANPPSSRDNADATRYVNAHQRECVRPAKSATHSPEASPSVVEEWAAQCGHDAAGIARLDDMLSRAGLEPRLVHKCIADSGGVDANVPNKLLEAQVRPSPTRAPAL